MPNWCMTDIWFYSDNKEQLKNFYDKVVTIYEGKPAIENDFGNGWLGDYVNALIPDLCDEVRFRGAIETISELDETVFSIYVMSAWAHMIQMWLAILDRHYPDIKLHYAAIEPGFEIYAKSRDNFFAGDYEFVISLNKADNKEYDYYYQEYSFAMEDLQRVIEDCFGAEVYNKIPKDYWELETEEDCKKLSDYLSQYLDDSKEEFIYINKFCEEDFESTC